MEQSDIKGLEDKELAKLLMEMDNKRAQSESAEDIYWLCIKEINRRIANGETDDPDESLI